MRVTVDVDNPSRLRVEYPMRVLKLLGGQVFIRKSASRGLHIKAHGLNIPFWASLVLRALLGDDRHRVLFDFQRTFKPKQLLFTVKDGKLAGRWYYVP